MRLFFLLMLGLPVAADPLYLVRSRGALDATDLVEWGAFQNASATTLHFTSSGGISVSAYASDGGNAGVSCSNPCSGVSYAYGPSEPLLYANFPGILNITFASPLSGIGGQFIDSSGGAQFTLRMRAFDSTDALIAEAFVAGTNYPINAGPPALPFYGFSANDNVISRFQIEITDSPSKPPGGLFYSSPTVGNLSLRTGPGPYGPDPTTPEPSTLALFAAGAGLLVWRRKWRDGKTLKVEQE